MKKIALALALLSLPVYADTHVYECEMSVAEVKNDVIRNVVKASYGAMVVDSGEQFYVVRDDRVLSSPISPNVTANCLAWVKISSFTTNQVMSTAFTRRTPATFR